MLRGAWLYVIAAGLGALCLSEAHAGERVTYNETVLDCAAEGCFVVRYVPAPSLKSFSKNEEGNAQSDSGGEGAQQDQWDADETALSLVGEPETESKQSNTDSAKTKEENGGHKKRRTLWDRFSGLFNAAEDWTAWGTWAAAIVAVIAVILLRKTLDATRSAVRASFAAVGVARKANDLIKAASAIENRAWLYVDEIRIDHVSPWTPDGEPEKVCWSLIVSFLIRNSGNLPATNICASFTLEFLPTDFATNFPRRLEELKADSTRHGGWALAPSAEIRMKEQLLMECTSRAEPSDPIISIVMAYASGDDPSRVHTLQRYIVRAGKKKTSGFTAFNEQALARPDAEIKHHLMYSQMT